MNKRKYFFALTLFISLTGLGQSKNYFEGKIIYKRTYKVKAENLSPEFLEQVLGSGSTLSFKQGNYRHDYRGGRLEFDLYIRADNKYYFKRVGNDTIFWIDCGSAGEKIEDFKFVPGKENILGILCDRIMLRFKDHLDVQYYNADSIAINPAWFSNYKRDDEYLVDEKEKSIFLKSETDFPRFVIINTAIQVTRLPIDNRTFKLPAGAILAKDEE